MDSFRVEPNFRGSWLYRNTFLRIRKCIKVLFSKVRNKKIHVQYFVSKNQKKNCFLYNKFLNVNFRWNDTNIYMLLYNMISRGIKIPQ